ncbi:50S ribosomal protein L13 [Candidatus Micrarchaeota archaeon]|nr:50S ribosomal protein L13 [Candidatus Micrarchaeota archaeon]
MQVIDAKDTIFGRAASQIAKKLINGEEIQIINAEQFVIVGNPEQIVQRYLTKRGLKHKGNPELSPKWPKVPHMLVKKMVSGMLPRKSSRGKDALERLMVYTGNPKNMDENLKLEKVSFDGLSKHITLQDLCKRIGYTG